MFKFIIPPSRGWFALLKFLINVLTRVCLAVFLVFLIVESVLLQSEMMMILEDLVLQNLPARRFSEAWGLETMESTGLGREKYWYSFAGFMTNLPYLAKLTMEGAVFFHAHFAMWDVNLVPAHLNFTDLKAMKSMGQVDHIVCPKSAFFSSGHIFTAAFKIGGQLFANARATSGDVGLRGTKGGAAGETGQDGAGS